MEGTQRITKREAANILGVTGQTVTNLVERGALGVDKSGKWWYFSREEVEALVPKCDGLREAERAIAEVEKELEAEALARTGILDVRRSRKEFINSIGDRTKWFRYKELVSALYLSLEKTGLYGGITAREKVTLESVLNLTPLAEVAQAVGMTEERVRQIFERALRRMIHFTTKVAPEILALREKLDRLEEENAALRVPLRNDRERAE